MDRTNAIKRLNTEEIVTEVNNVIKKGLDKLLGDYLYRYELLEQTHDAIMNLPSVRSHLNQSPLPPQQCENNNNNVKYEEMIEKLLKRIQELTFEVNQLKQTRRKECADIKVEDELKVVKLEQKENIRLEIEDVASEAEAEDDDESSVSEASEDEAASANEIEEEAEASANEIEEEAASANEIEEEAVSLEEENICSECDCKVILDEDIVVVDGKNYCGACDPTSTKEEDDEVEEQEEAEEAEDDVETEKSESDASEAEEDEEEVEAVASEAVADEEEEYIEIDIDDITYCTNNEENGFIYELTEDGDVGNKIGYLKDGEPFFYADEK
jgi:hypothetical protein